MIARQTLSAARKLAKRAAPDSRLMRVAFYAAEGVRMWSTGHRIGIGELARTYPRWQQTQANTRKPLVDGSPWISFGARAFLEATLRPDMTVFEYGAGGSTVFFAQRVARGESVEHDGAWVDNVRASLDRAGQTNWTVHHVAPAPAAAGGDPASPVDYVSSNPTFAGKQFRAYASFIDSRPAFDLVLVDGFARPSCAHHALPKVKPGGYLVLDNAERGHYRWIHDTLGQAGWTRREFYGPGPYVLRFWSTTIWQKPA